MASTRETKLDGDVQAIFEASWNVRSGLVVPYTEDVALGNGGVKLDAVVLYADLAHSTRLARKLGRSVTAKIVRAYLSSMTQLVKDAGGEVRSFDGDRVMGVFVGASKNSSAANCALKMNYVVSNILRPRAETKFPSLSTNRVVIAHCVGIHASPVLVARGGVRGTNDLVFVGSAPNIAAKLSEVRNSPYHVYVTHTVFNKLNRGARTSSQDKPMWTPVQVKLSDETWDCYRSSWWRQP
jgi:class 3 adenylate cyclase